MRKENASECGGDNGTGGSAGKEKATQKSENQIEIPIEKLAPRSSQSRWLIIYKVEVAAARALASRRVKGVGPPQKLSPTCLIAW